MNSPLVISCSYMPCRMDASDMNRRISYSYQPVNPMACAILKLPNWMGMQLSIILQLLQLLSSTWSYSTFFLREKHKSLTPPLLLHITSTFFPVTWLTWIFLFVIILIGKQTLSAVKHWPKLLNSRMTSDSYQSSTERSVVKRQIII